MAFSKSSGAVPLGATGASNYPLPLTYMVLGTSMLFSAISTGLLGYFTYYLNMDSMSVPWEFIIVSLPKILAGPYKSSSKRANMKISSSQHRLSRCSPTSQRSSYMGAGHDSSLAHAAICSYTAHSSDSG
jgi:hypothetical protein